MKSVDLILGEVAVQFTFEKVSWNGMLTTCVLVSIVVVLVAIILIRNKE